ncbi:MAG: LysR family transcriptional regulator, partial [Polyangiaceae bacterium]|nr:LysR family transcriptional regulator [Polyangiaceae bacterium]
ALSKFHAHYPEIKLKLGVSDREVDVVADGVDCVIRGGKPPPSELVARRIGDLAFGTYAAPSYLSRCGRPAHPRELENPPHKVVGFLRPRLGTVRTLGLTRGKEAVALKGYDDVAIDDGDAYLAAGVAGLGVVAVPTYMARAYTESGELVRMFADWNIGKMPLYVLSPPQRHPALRVRAFVEWVVALLKDGTVT